MILQVTTPLAQILDADDVRHVRAEDESGAFGILDGHADFLTTLAVSVVTWRGDDGSEHYVAVRGGLLSVDRRGKVAIATPEAVTGDDLHRLESETLGRFRQQIDDERAAHRDAQRLYLSALRQITRLMRPESGPATGSIPRIDVPPP
jgi:F-type H+-transporting ATPase subunit epsilon